MFNLTYCHGDNSRRNSNRNMTTKTALFPGNSVKRSSRPEVFCKIRRKTPVPGSLTCKFIKKETLPQVFSCYFCEISKNTFYYRSPLVVSVSKALLKKKTLEGQRISFRVSIFDFGKMNAVQPSIFR